MSGLERVFHAVLFEVLAVSLSIGLLMFFTDHQVGALSGTMIIIATIAMAWNFVFNWGFDQFFPGDKTKRTIAKRAFHVVLFELGLLALTIPVMAAILGVSLYQAFIMDVGVTVFITIYAFVFNFIYDHIGAIIVKKRRNASTLTVSI
ncbi:PACE efflux transporter [Photobacterium sp. ZSDE20]|uniref:PACE efflux transporter n=1 Tax=Photobacterium pectinilyticum TaxID=2906793 RepID=A0ABT1N936_9GAMM|nr:PACE efflux transporter [Photobacterium sp. ZSDE20]MCQ1061243.1 PACE efflux transporter [Photobacterium sp. ZSDE20]MDD1829686.1 PACE efflux transporter [Photobacterium sp. ZSDE20]